MLQKSETMCMSGENNFIWQLQEENPGKIHVKSPSYEVPVLKNAQSVLVRLIEFSIEKLFVEESLRIKISTYLKTS